MKAPMLQVDGITWFDRMEFKAFNECKKLKSSVIKHKMIFKDSHQLAADRIYATNENRRYLSQKQVFHTFVPKGKPAAKDVKQSKANASLKKQLDNVRSTHLEGAFGNHKNHYGLRKVKALKESTERVWVFFGVMSANAVLITKRKLSKTRESPPLPLAA